MFTAAASLFLIVYSLVYLIFTAPHNWDSMTYHLARVAYFIQHQNIESFSANYWAQVVHPKLSAILNLYVYVAFGGGENLTQIVQFISYLVCIVCVYEICRAIGGNLAHSIITACLASMLIGWLMQATTTQNDLLITSFVGVATLSILRYRNTASRKYFIVISISIALAFAIKASFLLVVPSLAILLVWAFYKAGNRARGKISEGVLFLALLLLALTIFAAPAGYMENVRIYGHPVGPKIVRQAHSFEGKSVRYILVNGTKNLVRYSLDFFSLDGLPRTSYLKKTQRRLRRPLVNFLKPLNLDGDVGVRVRFKFNRRPFSSEDRSYWGIIGFGLIIPLALVATLAPRSPSSVRVLGVAFWLFFTVQAFAGPYDPWRGRYFVISAIFAMPILVNYLSVRNLAFKTYVLIIVLAGVVSAFSAVLFRENSYAISFTHNEKKYKSVFDMDRIQLLTRNGPVFEGVVREYYAIVPAGSVVAVAFREDTYEYPFFGEKLSRELLPINDFYGGLKPIPPMAEYLLYDRSYPCKRVEDIDLSHGYFLRKLSSENRNCSDLGGA